MGVALQGRRQDASSALVAAAAAAPVLDVVGRLLAPSLLFSSPGVVVAMSPTDGHVLLADPALRVRLLVLAFGVRTLRAWLIYEACGGRGWRSLERITGRLARRARDNKAAAVLAVIVLPGMPGGVLAAQAGLRRTLYLPALIASNLAGAAVTMAASFALDSQLTSVAGVVARHPRGATAVAAFAIASGYAVRRLRRTDADRAELTHLRPCQGGASTGQ